MFLCLDEEANFVVQHHPHVIASPEDYFFIYKDGKIGLTKEN